MRLRHPNRDTLVRWLNGESDANLDLHVDTCQRCASNLEALESDAESDIGDALAEALAPPDDLTARLTEGVAAKLSSRQVMDVVADLFGAGLETTRLLLIEEPDDND
ncbi:MAG: hypothetical protein OEV40_04885 [Acidimicrobiia bacterium]|nr:hypothetical protein [Acidimicrobiia bacterium]